MYQWSGKTLYIGNEGQERWIRVRTKGRDIIRALHTLNHLELIIGESTADETAEDLEENDTSVVELPEDKNDLSLSS